MSRQRIGYRTIFPVLFLAAGFLLVAAVPVHAQSAAGVVVDANGELHKRIVADPTGRLFREQVAAARATLDRKVASFSRTRYLSLNRLEAALAANNGVLTDEMRYLAGLQRIEYVFCYPESGDIVIGGPAEGWVTNPAGRVVGLTSGRPVLRLEDLVAALRAFPPGQTSKDLIGCSIDPTQEGLAAMQEYLQRIGSHFNTQPTPQIAQQIAAGLRNNLGLQTVSIWGVSPKTHFAQVLVEADYRMKLIGIGLEEPPVRMTSYVRAASPAQVSRNAMQRWYFTPDYQCVRVSDNELAMQLVGDGVKVVGEGELVNEQGGRAAAANQSRASKAFTMSFTKNYSALAKRSPVFAELRNLIDLSVVAAFIQQQDYHGKTGWKMELFGDEAALAIETYNAVKQVGTAVNAIWKSNRLMTPVGGGVEILANLALDAENLLVDEKQEVEKLRKELKVELPEGQWWWD